MDRGEPVGETWIVETVDEVVDGKEDCMKSVNYISSLLHLKFCFSMKLLLQESFGVDEPVPLGLWASSPAIGIQRQNLIQLRLKIISVSS